MLLGLVGGVPLLLVPPNFVNDWLDQVIGGFHFLILGVHGDTFIDEEVDDQNMAFTSSQVDRSHAKVERSSILLFSFSCEDSDKVKLAASSSYPDVSESILGLRVLADVERRFVLTVLRVTQLRVVVDVCL